MNITGKKESFFLFIGDIVFFITALWATLWLRYLEIPTLQTLKAHSTPFSILFLIWILIFFIAGLYEKQSFIFKNKLASKIITVQTINIIVAVLFFYFIPYSNIAPKTNLFIYLLVSPIFIYLWRISFFYLIGFKKKENAILIGSGKEMKEILDETKNNKRYGLNFFSFIDLDEIESINFQEEIINKIYNENINLIVADLKNKKIEIIFPHLYNLIFSKIKLIDINKLYENIFDKIPLSLISYRWFIENISSANHFGYDILKRLMDIIISLFLGVISLVFYPFVFVAIKLEDGGPVFFRGERVGKKGKIISLIKFRSMSINSKGGGIEKKPQITKIGAFLRKTRIDELPQIINVLKGELSLIGPRPETPELVKEYKKNIPYYNIRHIIKPGLSGWAQMYHENHPHHGIDINETKIKLSYDLYYIKNKSFIFDLKIALKTIKTLLSRGGI